ncbi:hypothetical protein HPP92_012002 [Vanilla planifolia]|uniref:Uncharacterized protein n=1 Tax=Vanilla planifolia TaxID=51239 RepID=A0A835QYQ4_VANPL|nr:hypothetical protein HPP92_012002 [Vanilla planifolia]
MVSLRTTTSGSELVDEEHEYSSVVGELVGVHEEGVLETEALRQAQGQAGKDDIDIGFVISQCRPTLLGTSSEDVRELLGKHICLPSKLQTQMLFLKILFAGIHLVTGRMMMLMACILVMQLNQNSPPGLPKVGSRSVCLNMEIHGGRFGMPHLLYLHLNRDLFFDPIREGEKILHYLETLQPQQLLVQMVRTAFRASADTLSRTAFGEFRLMKVKIEQLYHTLASTLRPLQENRVVDKVEMFGDLNRLCTVFEHIENLVILAASVHHKLYDAPRLSEAIFQDYFNFYLPKMGTGSESLCFDKEYTMKQLVKVHERDVIASFFPPPTANQSWRKVLSMGNLLFGHEPILREIIFSVYDKVSNFGALMDDVETHRMYICGTSNDLRVALSVTSWD